MAANFFKWQADPFFEAAEDIQDSADRLESSSRKWLRAMAGGRKQMGLLPEESISIKHLITACSTVKWQLEEFERAIEEAAEGEYVPGSGTLDRRKQFIEALRGQIRDVEEDIYDCREAASAGTTVQDHGSLADFLLAPASSHSPPSTKPPVLPHGTDLQGVPVSGNARVAPGMQMEEKLKGTHASWSAEDVPSCCAGCRSRSGSGSGCETETGTLDNLSVPSFQFYGMDGDEQHLETQASSSSQSSPQCFIDSLRPSSEQFPAYKEDSASGIAVSDGWKGGTIIKSAVSDSHALSMHYMCPRRKHGTQNGHHQSLRPSRSVMPLLKQESWISFLPAVGLWRDSRKKRHDDVGAHSKDCQDVELGLANGAPVKESEDEGEEMKDLLGLRSVIRRSVHRSHVAVMQRGPLFVATMGLLVLGMIGLLAFCRGARGMSSST